MTIRDLVADVRKRIGASKREPTPTEACLAYLVIQYAKGCSAGYIKAIPLGGPPELNLDTEIVE